MKSVLEKLQLTVDELNSLYTPCPVNGKQGNKVAECIAQQYGLTEDESLGEGLFRSGILTQEEANWLDDV